MKIISSQRFLDDAIVDEKRAAGDYTVTLGKIITVDGEEFRVVVDGHHSLAAAKADGVTPEYIFADATMSDKEGIEDTEQYLEAMWIDAEYYSVQTGEVIW